LNRKSILLLLGGLIIGLVVAILLIPALFPQGMAKPFGFNN